MSDILQNVYNLGQQGEFNYRICDMIAGILSVALETVFLTPVCDRGDWLLCDQWLR